MFEKGLTGSGRRRTGSRDGRTGAASAVRRLDPATGEVVEVLATARVRFSVPEVANGRGRSG